MRVLVCSLIILGLSGCSHFDRPGDPNYAPVYPAYKPTPEPHHGSVYHEGTGLSLYEDIKALHVGDIITVVLNERTDGSKSGETTIDKDSSATIQNPTIFSASPEFSFHKSLPIPLTTTDHLNLQTAINATRNFEGSADSSQQNELTGTITVTVDQVYPNGNLLVKGEKWITINHGEEFIRLAGIIRPEDINPDNTIMSNKIADARITYSGTGSVQNANKPGWFTRLINHWLFPI